MQGFNSFNGSELLNQSAELALSEALTLSQELLAGFAESDENFLETLSVAFGELFDTLKSQSIRQKLIQNDFRDFPKITILNQEDIYGANGAFDVKNNQIYLASDFLENNSGNSAVIADVLLEEIGHYIDKQINSTDASGDEGSIFSHIVQGKSLSGLELANLLNENDHANITIDNEIVGIEKSDPFFPNDPRFDEQWSLHNTGQTGGTDDADIDAPEAWAIQQGDSNIILAVIDTGIDYNHEDLAANMWRNPEEIAGNNIDDDGNGFVDDIFGFDFENNDNDPFDDAYPITDRRSGHGTHVAGIIGAVADNEVGISGVAPNIRLMALKAAGQNGFPGNAVVNAIDYAIAQNANVINYSAGKPSTTSFYDAISRANDAGILFVTSAGNDAFDLDGDDFDEDGFDWTENIEDSNFLVVQNTNSNDIQSSLSNFGLVSVDVGAPGSRILSTLPDNSYGFKSGTSMAAPHVSGVASLIFSENSTLSPAQVKQIIMSTVDLNGDLAGTTVSGGRVNAKNALRVAQGATQKITLEIDEILEIDRLDSPPFGSPADFTAKVVLDDSSNTRNAPGNTGNPQNLGWQFSTFTKDSLVDLSIELVDRDGGLRGPDDIADISPEIGRKVLELQYNTVTDLLLDQETGKTYSKGADGRFYFQGDKNTDQTGIWFRIQPELATIDSDQSLLASAGVYAVENTPIDETISFKHLSGFAGNEVVEVNINGITQNLSSFETIRVSSSDGDDIITLDGVRSTAYLKAGDGDDIIEFVNTEPDLTNGSIIVADAGNDVVKSGAGNDSIHGKAGNDRLFGNLGDDHITGGGDDDYIEGNQGDDVLSGDSGDPGKDEIHGGLGNDTIGGGGNADVIYGNEGNDVIWGDSSFDIVDFRTTAPVGTEGIDIIDGGTGDDEIYGEGNNDELIGGSGNDFIDGNDGIDTVIYQNSTDRVVVNLDESQSYSNSVTSTPIDLEGNFNIDSGKALDGFRDIDTLRNLENIIGSEHSDILVGNSEANKIEGLDGNDLLIGNTGADLLDGNDGQDTVSYRRDPNAIDANLATNTAIDGFGDIDTLQNIENVVGSNFDDNIIGDAQNNIVTAGDGNDIVKTGAGDDQLYGENGDDYLTGEAGNDLIDGNDGIDTVKYDNSPTGVVVNIDEATNYQNIGGYEHTSVAFEHVHVISTDEEPDFSIDAGSAIDGFGTEDTLQNLENIVGSNYQDVLVGNEKNNQIEGRSDDDVLIGNAGDDYLDGGEGQDTASYRRDPNAVTINLEQNQAIDGFGNTDTLQSIENAIGSVQSDHIIGDELDNSLNGNTGDDLIEGRDGNDIVFGELGEDTIFGEEGNDFLVGGQDADALDGGEGNDTASYFTSSERVAVSLRMGKGWAGDAKRDSLINIENLEGSEFDDQLYGNDENNIISGLGGRDLIKGDAGNDSLYGNEGGDRLYGGKGDDYLEGNEGNDLLKGEKGHDTVLGGEGNDQLYGDQGDDVLDGGTGNDFIDGGKGHDELLGGDGNDQLYGQNGYDFLDAGDGDDYLDGGKGNDELLGGAGDDQLYGQQGQDLIDAGAGNDYVEGGSQDDIITGGDGNDRLYGQNGDDDLFGDAGDDLLKGGRNEDLLVGDEGNDRLYGEHGHDILEGGDGIDLLDGGSHDDYLYGGNDGDRLYGQDGEDFLDGGNGNDRLEGGSGDDQLFGERGLDYLDGGKGEDQLYGGADNDQLFGNLGNDYLEGEAGDDQLFGDQGNDSLYGGNGNDFLDGGAGNDYLEGGAGNDELIGNSGNDFLYGNHGKDNLYGGSGNDNLKGGNSGDRLYGEEGNDLLYGEDGHDILKGGEGDNYLDGGDGNDQLITGSGEDYLLGSDGNDYLFGGAGDDQLLGGSGNDLIVGSDGWDLLTGGEGDDIFFFGSFAEGIDVITDFSSGNDVLQISASGFGQDLALGTLTEDSFQLGSTASDAADRFIYDASTGGLYFDVDGIGVSEQIRFATLSNNTNLTNTDLIIV